MKLNKTLLLGIIFILIAGVIFLTDILNSIIRPITYQFLMGSSKGKDIMFFGLVGFFLILSQSIKKEINIQKYFKVSLVLGGFLLVLGILLEVLFRLQMGIKLNTIFASMTSTMSTTSILHTHLLKSILGAVLTQIIGPFIQSDINTGVGLYSYVPSIGFLIVLLFPILFITLVLASQKRQWPSNFLFAFFSSCLIIGTIDGGLFGTPAIVGICGLYLVYINENYLNFIIGYIIKDKKLIESNEFVKLEVRKYYNDIKYILKRYSFVFLVLFIIFLRFSIAFAGAETDYYTVDIANPKGDIDLGNISVEVIDYDANTSSDIITYKIDPSYNEMELLNDLKIPLNNSCEYYTVSWNIYSYLEE